MPLSPARLLAFATRLPVLIAAGLYALWVAFGFLAVDPLAQKLLPWLGREKLASELSASKVEFNPLTLEATVTGLKLAEPGGAPLASAERVYANLDIAGLFRFAWRIRDLGLDAPRASFDIRADGTHNWRKLFDKLAEDKEPPSDTLPRVLIDRIRIARGDLRFSDARRAGEPFRAAATPLDFSLDGLSTLPEDRGDYTLAAKLPEQGGTLKWRGEIGLNPVASNGRVALEGVKLANLTRLVKSERRFDVASGALAAALDYRFALLHTRQGEDVPSLRIDHGTLAIADLALAPRGGAPLARLASLRVDGAQFDLLRREARLAGVRLNGLDVAATRRADGAFDWLELLPPPAAAPAPAGAKGDKSQAGAPWKLAVGAIALADGALRYTDQSFAAPLALAADGLGFNATLDAAFGDTTRLTLGGLHVALGTTTLHSGKTELARLQGAALADGAYTLADSSLSVGALEFSGLAGAVVLDAQKRLNWAEALKPARGARQPAAREATPGAPPLRLALAKLALADFAVRVEDRSAKTPVRLDLVNGYVRLAGLSHDPARAIPVEAGFSVRQGGRFSARGEFVPGKPAGKFALELAGLSLKPFAPYVNQAARLKLQSGAAGSRGRLAFAPGKRGLRLDYAGGFAVNDLAITEEDTDQAFLGWKSLRSDSLEVALNPNRLAMAELVATRAFGKLIIFEDKSVNLKRILRTPAAAPAEAGAGAAAGATPAETRAAAGPDEAAFPVSIERLRIVAADAEFADLSLVPQFGTKVHDLNGVVTGLSTDPQSKALVELDGKVDDYGSARVRGTIRPFDPTAFTDIALTFRNLEMANLTPYSGKFAGRRIDSGKLSVDLQYKIDHRQLAGENKFVINKIQLGPHVDSPDAVNLPLDLAIALLEDSDGVIDLDLPISGSLDDPQFSYGRIVWKAIVNVLTKLVTAPFRALGKLLGIGSEKLEAVEFDAGSATLAPPELEKLKKVGVALAKRPALTLTVEPAWAPAADARALREARIRREVAARMGLQLEAGESPGPVDTANPRAQKALEKLYNERFEAAGGVRALKAELEKTARPEAGKPAPPDRLHAELLARLTAQPGVPDAELSALAAARGAAINQALLAGGVDPARLALAAAAAADAGDGPVKNKLSLGARRK